jgi:hypothetical protein
MSTWQVDRTSVHVRFDTDGPVVEFPGCARPMRLRTLELSEYPDGAFGVWAHAIPLDQDGAEQFSTSTRGWRTTAVGAPLGTDGHLSPSLLAVVDEIHPGWWPTRATVRTGGARW